MAGCTNPERLRIPGVLQRIALCYWLAAIAARYLEVRGLLALSAMLLLGYWALLLITEPSDLALTKLGNIGNEVDRYVFGVQHLYHVDHDFDPEGLPGTLPAVVNCDFGYLAGLYARRHGAGRLVALRYLGIGIVLFAAAWPGIRSFHPARNCGLPALCC